MPLPLTHIIILQDYNKNNCVILCHRNTMNCYDDNNLSTLFIILISISTKKVYL